MYVICLLYLKNKRGCGTVAARPLCMRKVRGSTPRISMQCSNGHVFDSRWVLNVGTYSSEVERSIAELLHFGPTLAKFLSNGGLYLLTYGT